jgi:hypothetical protein
MDEPAGYNASFWRDAAACLRRLATPVAEQEAALIDVLWEIVEEEGM